MLQMTCATNLAQSTPMHHSAYRNGTESVPYGDHASATPHPAGTACPTARWQDSIGWKYRIECDQNGRIERAFKSYDSSSGEKLWYVAPDERDLETIIDSFEDLLVEQIPESVKEAKLKLPVCALVLRYPGESLFEGHLIDMVALTPDSRTSSMQAGGREYGWACDAEHGVGGDLYLDFCPKQMLEKHATKELQYLAAVRECDDAVYFMIETIRNVCRRLNMLDWSAICAVTDDFVVVPWDTTGEIDWGEDIERCVSDEQFAKLEKGKWI